MGDTIPYRSSSETDKLGTEADTVANKTVVFKITFYDVHI